MCTHETAKIFAALRGGRYPAEFGANSAPASAMDAPSSCASCTSEPSGNSARFVGVAGCAFGGAPEETAFGGRASTISFKICSHIGSCRRPRCPTSAWIRSCKACTSSSGAPSRSMKSCPGSCMMDTSCPKPSPGTAKSRMHCAAAPRTAQEREPPSSGCRSLVLTNSKKLLNWCGARGASFTMALAVETQSTSVRTMAKAVPVPDPTYRTCLSSFQMPRMRDTLSFRRSAATASFDAAHAKAAERTSSATTQSTSGDSKKSARRCAVASRKESFRKGAKAGPAACMERWMECSIQSRTGCEVSFASLISEGAIFRR
mmetsp:Transcript_123616/g.395452  ORF Transcript_123616/g.395452 Transcript_123616/m.395452 type:complete len:317 (-) Transcript_123616:3501-4451(-)